MTLKTSSITVAIPVRNEGKNLETCLSAIGTNFAEHIVVIDSNSIDSTVSIAHSYGANVIQFEWNGSFPKKRNWFLRNHTPMTDWVLFLDADEILNMSVKKEIATCLTNSHHQGYILSYSNYFLGRRLRGGYPLRKLALFRVGEVEYEYIDENNWSKCDMEVHEHPIASGSVGRIRNKIDHRDFRGIDSYMEKHNQYASWEANRLFYLANNSSLRQDWTLKQHIKYKIIAAPWGGLVFFFLSYFGMGGWRDGRTGLVFSLLKASYFTQIACRLSELKMQTGSPERSDIIKQGKNLAKP